MFEKYKLKKRIKEISKDVNFRIAYKCPVAWEDMIKVSEDDKVKHCKKCKLNVYNLLGLTSDEISQIVQENGGQICGQVNIRNEDNSVLFGNCDEVPARIIRRGKIVPKK